MDMTTQSERVTETQYPSLPTSLPSFALAAVLLDELVPRHTN